MFNLRRFCGGGRVASRDDHFVQKTFIKYLHGLIGPLCMTLQGFCLGPVHVKWLGSGCVQIFVFLT